MTVESPTGLTADEIVFRTTFTKALSAQIVFVALYAAYATWRWYATGTVSLLYPALFLAFGYFSYRGTYVAVSPEGLRIKSPFSSEASAKRFAWAEITDAVITKNWSHGVTLEVRSGSRFGWVHYQTLAKPEELKDAVRRFGGEDSAVYRGLLEIEFDLRAA